MRVGHAHEHRSHAASSVDEHLNAADYGACGLGQEESNVGDVRRLHESTDRDRLAFRLDDIRGHWAIRDTGKLVEQRSITRRGTDCVESQLILCELERHRLGCGRHTGFGGVVPCLTYTRANGVLARDDDSRARPVFLHLRNEDSRREVDALDVHVEEACELFRGDLDA